MAALVAARFSACLTLTRPRTFVNKIFYDRTVLCPAGASVGKSLKKTNHLHYSGAQMRMVSQAQTSRLKLAGTQAYPLGVGAPT
jgi:hypothetical protein